MVNPASEIADDLLDISRVVRLRKHISRAAFSFQLIGFWSWFVLLGYLVSNELPLPALMVAILGPGLVISTAKRLKSGSLGATGMVLAWSLLWICFMPIPSLKEFLLKSQDNMHGNVYIYDVIAPAIFFVLAYLVVRGIIARFSHQLTKRREVFFLLNYPWEEGLRVKRRPRFMHLLNSKVIFFILLSPLPYLWVWASQQTHGLVFASSQGDAAGRWIGSLHIMILQFYLGVKIYRRARRAAMLPGSALTKRDKRPYVLYLRSFQDDTAITLRARASNGRILPEKLLKIPFEEVVCDHLWGYGPVLAIGNPQTQGQPLPLGAAREFASDSSWQHEVAEMMRHASMIIAVAGQTDGLAWEIDKVLGLGFISKLVLLLPPVAGQDRQARLHFIANHVPKLELPVLPETDHVLAVIFPQEHPTLLAGDELSDWTYEAVLDQAAISILGDPQHNKKSVHSFRSLLAGLPRTIWKEASIYLWTGILFMVTGSFIVISYGFNSLHDQFIEEAIRTCMEGAAGKQREKLNQFCLCHAEEMASSVTYADVMALKIIDSLDDDAQKTIRKEIENKSTAASQMCSNAIR